MSKERRQTPQESFKFTDDERLFDRISDKRFDAMLQDKQTTIHEVNLSSNSFGEFLFVTASGIETERHRAFTFWGLGFHEPREKWVSEYWSWFESQRTFDMQLDKEVAFTEIAQRRQDVFGWDHHEQPSRRAQLYSLLADLSDEDGALTELDDFGDFD